MLVPIVSAGDLVIRLIEQCVDANLPLLLSGPHGIGKSELFKTAAQRRGIDFISRDLSLMEPTDLIGMPYVEEGRTHFAPPAFLPRDGCGLLILEEINRAPRYMVAPCLQLLTERRLNDYELPPGWIPMASMNPGGADYHVDELDPALLSRFVQAELQADLSQWMYWARENEIHPTIIKFANQSPGIFAPGETNPRAWAYVSKQVKAWEKDGHDTEILGIATAGLVGETWAVAFRQFLSGGDPPLTELDIIDSYKRHRKKLTGWVGADRFDIVRASMHVLRRHLVEQKNYQTIANNSKKVENVRGFINDMPADLREEMRDWLADKNYEKLMS